MADYPPTPPFGLAPSRAPPHREASYQGIYDNGDVGQSERVSFLEQQKAQTREAFAQNAKVPTFSAASVASGVPPLPIYEDVESLLYGYQSKMPGYERALDRPRSRATYKSPSGPSHMLPVPPKKGEPAFSTLRASITQNVEEGELSEGEFEETPPIDYRNAVPMAKRDDYYSRQKKDLQSSTHREGFNAGNAESEVNHGAPLTDMYGRSIDLNRHRSESYSPYEPPNETEYEPHLAQEVLGPRHQQSYHDDYEPPEEFPRVQRVRQSKYGSESSRYGSLESPDQNYAAHKPLLVNIEIPSFPDASRSDIMSKSVHDARKEAQNAILNLLPLKIRYRDYIEEGIDELVVRRQFEGLGFPLTANDVLPNKPYEEITISNSLQEAHIARQLSPEDQLTPQALQANRIHDVVQENFTSSHYPSPAVTNNSGQKQDNIDFVESRKDRIARLLAEKKKKLPPPVMQSSSPAYSGSPEASQSNKATTTSHSAAKADKERLLRQKMEALQKSREQRAQKAAAKTAIITASTIVDVADGTAQKLQTQSIPGTQDSSRPRLATSSSPVQVVSKPSIPGLFLASGPAVSQNQANQAIVPSPVQIGGQRKRPVASDFDKPTSIPSPNRRPFGQNRNDQPLVIDVSDDDSDASNHSDMDVDRSHLVDSGGVPLQGSTNLARIKAIRDLPPLSDFPPRKPFPTPSSTMNTPLAAQPLKPSLSKPEDLHRKELEIQEMKRRIAEAERRKKAKQNSSGSQTPKPQDAIGTSAIASGVSLVDKIDASIQIEHLIDDASRQVDQDQLKLVETHAEEQAAAEELRRSEAERKRLRRAEIASNIPVVNAEVEKAQKQLADLRAEIAKIEFEIQKGLDNKRILAEEMEKLSQEVDEQLQSQKNALNRLKFEAIGSAEAPDHTEPNRIITNNTPSLVQESVDAIMSDVQPTVDLESDQQEERNATNDTTSASTSTSYPPTRDISIGSTEPAPKSPNRVSSEQPVANPVEASPSRITTGEALEVALQHVTAQVDTQSDPGSGSDVEMTDSLAPDPEVLAPVSAEDLTESSQQDGNLAESSEASVNIADGESDPYEPPEATPSPVNMTTSVADSPPFSPAPPHATSGKSHTNRQHDNVSKSPNEMTASRTFSNNSDIALSQANQDGHSQAGRKTFFTPYESPLKSFRAFRFHPTFQQEIQGGFKSITYSNNILEGKELCRYELAGGVCNDSSCEFQHFRDMGLADDAILVELGNSAGYSEEDKPRFVSGLRTVLQGLRSKKTKDFHVIASEIAAYRARFLGDRSKILLLEESSS